MVDVLGHLPHNGVLVGLHGGLRLAGQRAGGGVALPAAPASAGALDAVLDNDVVTHFTGGEVEAAQNLAAQDNAAADAGAQSNDDRIVVPLCTARNVLAVGGGVGVVLDIDLAAEQVLEVRAEVPVVIAEVRVEAYEAGGKVHAAGRADADIFDVGKIDLIILGHGAAQVGQCLFQILRRARQTGGPGQLADDLIIFVDNTGGHCGAAQVDTNRVFAHNKIPPTSSAQGLPCSCNSCTRFSRVAFTISSCGNCISSSMA